MRYRRGWNGLTEIHPEQVFIPEVMELQFFPVDKPIRLRVDAEPKKRRSMRNTVLWIVTGAALITLFTSALATPTVAGLAAFAGSGAWVATFFTANKRRWE